MCNRVIKEIDACFVLRVDMLDPAPVFLIDLVGSVLSLEVLSTEALCEQ
jgi:hypothetical protein